METPHNVGLINQRRRRRRRRQGLQEPIVHSAQFRSHWQRVRLYWDASTLLLAWPKFYSSYTISDGNEAKVCNLTWSYLITLPVDRPCTQRYRGCGPCHLSTGGSSSFFKYTCKE